LETQFVDDPKPLGFWTEIPHINDVNGEPIFSVAEEEELRVSKDENTGKYINESNVVITDFRFSASYGTPMTDGRYVILIALDSGGERYTWKEFNPKDYPVSDIKNYSVL
jgi:hypothetical protein